MTAGKSADGGHGAMTARIVDLHRANPEWTVSKIAAEVGCNRAYVSAVKQRKGLPIPTSRNMAAPDNTDRNQPRRPEMPRYQTESMPGTFERMSAADRRRNRIERHAEKLLEGPCRRRHWSPGTRDAIADMLEKIIAAEMKEAMR